MSQCFPAAERACGTELSTQRAACSAKHFRDDILASLLERAGTLLIDIRAAFTFLAGTPFELIRTAIDAPGASPQAFATPP